MGVILIKETMGARKHTTDQLRVKHSYTKAQPPLRLYPYLTSTIHKVGFIFYDLE